MTGKRAWTLRKKIGTGYALCLALALLLSLMSMMALRSVSATSDARLASYARNRMEVESLRKYLRAAEEGIRSYLVWGDARALTAVGRQELGGVKLLTRLESTEG